MLCLKNVHDYVNCETYVFGKFYFSLVYFWFCF